jgi:hypothetical protein
MVTDLVPEIIDPVFAKTSPNCSFSVIENERFGLVFTKTGSINSVSVSVSCKESILWNRCLGSLKVKKIWALFQVAWGHLISSPPPPTVLRANIFKEPRNPFQGINSSSLCGLRMCFYYFKDPRNRFQGIDSASLCSLAGWYDNPSSLPPIDCSKTPALAGRYNNLFPTRFLAPRDPG